MSFFQNGPDDDDRHNNGDMDDQVDFEEFDIDSTFVYEGIEKDNTIALQEQVKPKSNFFESGVIAENGKVTS